MLPLELDEAEDKGQTLTGAQTFCSGKPPVPMMSFSPEFAITFYGEDQKVVGTLTWKEGIVKFTGEVEPCAQAFMDHLGEYLNSSVQNQVARQVSEKLAEIRGCDSDAY